MLSNRQTYLPKSAYLLLTIFACLGLFVFFYGGRGHAQIKQEATESLSAAIPPAFVDNTFNPVLGGSSSIVTTILLQPDGKILVSGSFNVINGVNRNFLARFNADGTLDTSFDVGSGGNAEVFAMVLQSDGKIVIGGSFTNFAGIPLNRIARLNPNGSVDTSFNFNGTGVPSGDITEMKVLSDNKILIGGSFINYNGTAINRLAKLNADGSLDTTFSTGTGPSSTVFSIDTQSDGKIVIGGSFTNYNGTARLRLARINTDGSLDTSFIIGTGADMNIRSVVVQPDQNILVSGELTIFNGVGVNGITRLKPDGSADSAFNVSGIDAVVQAIALQPDGKMIVGGSFTQIAGGTRQCIARLNANGTLDTTFDPGTGIGPQVIFDLALQTDGKVIMVGSFLIYNGVVRGGIARANADGSLETGLNPTSSAAGQTNAIMPQSDGKILIGGTFSSVNGAARMNIARLNADSTPDTSFNVGTGASGSVVSFAIQSDGKIIIGGNFTNYNGTAINRIARLNTDGTLDTSFNPGTGGNGEVSSIALQTDGKILIGGAFTTYNTVTVNRIARLNMDGSLDTSFATGTAFNGLLRRVLIQPDGKIIATGGFTSFNAVTGKNRIIRINSNGSEDTTFVTGTGASSTVNAAVLQADGKIIIGGLFATFNGVTKNRIARINADGSLDTTFNTGTGFNSDVNVITLLSGGKCLVGGSFATINGLPRTRIVRLNADGSFDPTFASGLGAYGIVTSTIRAIVPNGGKFLLGGLFYVYNTSPRLGIAQISNTTDAVADFDGDGITDYSIIRRPGPIGDWTWWIASSGSNNVSTFNFGLSPRDIPQPGDFDGDGRDDIAMFRTTPLTNETPAYYIILSTTNTVKIIQFGLPGDVPLVEDYDGDGKDDPAVWRAPSAASGPGQATWFYLGSLNNPNNNITYVPWGMRYGTQSDQVDEPYSGDIDGDGRADFAIQRRVDITNPSLNTPAIFHILTASGNYSVQYFGLAGDRVVPGDYDGDGKTDICVSRGFNISPSTTTWYIRYSSGIADAEIQWGAGSLDLFAQGDYDGDGKTDLAVYRRAGEFNFYVRSSRDGSLMVYHWGSTTNDIPVANYNNR